MSNSGYSALIIGSGDDCKSLLEILSNTTTVRILAVVASELDTPAIELANRLGLQIASDFNPFLKDPTLNIVFDVSGKLDIHEELKEKKPAHADILGSNSVNVARLLIEENLSLKGQSLPQPLDYQMIFNLSPQAIVVVDINGKIVKLNNKLSDWLQYDIQEYVGRNILMLPFIPKDSKMRILEKFSDRLEGEDLEPYEIELRTKDNSIKIGLVSENLIRDENGKPSRILVVITDITNFSNRDRELNQVEVDAKEAEERYKLIFENSGVSIMFVDDQERIVSWNKNTEELLGMGKKELYLQQVSLLYPPEEWKKIRSADFRKSGSRHNIETKIKRKDNKIIDVGLTLSILKNEEGVVTGSIGVLNDVSKRKIAEKGIEKASKMQDDFLNMVAHELKSPITAVQGSIGIILDGSAGDISEEQQDFLNTAKRNLDRLDCLINDVVDYQKLEMGKTNFKLAQGNINDLIKSVKDKCEPAIVEKGLEITLKLDKELPVCMFDEEKIEKVLLNLIENSTKFTKKGGVSIISSVQQGIICIAIKDTGVGIKKEDISKLFRIFGQLTTGARRESGNTGLGLVISKIIVERHGGKMWVESELGKGSTFFFLLPSTKS